MDGDFQAFRACFQLPQVMETFSGPHRVEGEDDLQRIFCKIREYYRTEGITHMIRRCVSAEYRDEATIASTHESRLIRGGSVLARSPYPVFSILSKVNGNWLIAFSQYAIADEPDLARALEG